MKESELKQLQQSLTLEEKIGQLVQLSGEFYHANDISIGPQRKLGITPRTVALSGSVLNVAGADSVRRLQSQHLANSKHAIPLLFMSDIIYGYKTIYPIPLGMGATWDPELIRQAYENTAEEAYAGGQHVSFAPMVDLVRDARWGRVLESTGEDPYLNSSFAKAMVKGFQAKLDAGRGIVACVKHFAGYGAAESGREYNLADMSISTLFQNYLPAYHAAVNAGAKMMMTSLTTLNGVPSTADKWLLQHILREEWGFKGVVISDYASIFELVQHGFAQDPNDAAAKALDAGVDIDMKSPCYANGLAGLLKDGRLDEAKIDQAVWRVLTLKNDLGLFEDPFRGASTELEQKSTLTSEKRAFARKVSRESLVLLKNDQHILPLDPSQGQKIALIGPYADEHGLLGLWAVHADQDEAVTIKQGVCEYVSADHITVNKGTDILRDPEFFEHSSLGENIADQVISSDDIERQHRAAAIAAAQVADIIIFAGGEHPLQSAEAGSRSRLRLPANQQALLDDLAKLGKPIVTLVVSGRPLVLTDVLADSDAVLQTWFPGTEGGHAIADVLFGAYNPSGRLSMSMPAVESQAPIYYNHLATGRPEATSQHVGRFVSRYTDAPTAPLFSFGYGLSYGKVTYGEPQLSTTILHPDESLQLSVAVDNTSQIKQVETVQLYLHDKVATIAQPVKRLIGFKRVSLDANTKKTVIFSVSAQSLGFYNNQGKFVIEPGEFELLVGPNSDTVQCISFELQ